MVIFYIIVVALLINSNVLCTEDDNQNAPYLKTPAPSVEQQPVSTLESSSGASTNTICRVNFHYKEITCTIVDGRYVNKIGSGVEYIQAVPEKGLLSYSCSDGLQQHFLHALNMAIFRHTNNQVFRELAARYPELPSAQRDKIIMIGHGKNITITRTYKASAVHASIEYAAQAIAQYVEEYYKNKQSAQKAK